MGSSVILPQPGQPGPMRPDEFTSGSTPNIVSFSFDRIAPPSEFYVQRDDVLAIEAVSQLATDAITVTARLLLPYAQAAGQPGHPPPSGVPGGPIVGPGYIQTIQQTFQLTAARVETFQTIALAEGYLLSLTVLANTAGTLGDTFCRVFVNRGRFVLNQQNPAALLVSGYPSALEPIGWPWGVYTRSADGLGKIFGYQPANPGAGLDFSVATNSVGRTRLQSFTALLTTSAVAGNRIPLFRVTISGFPAFQVTVQDPTPEVASTVVRYTIGPGTSILRGAGAIGTEVDVSLALPGPLFGTGVVTIASTTQGILGGDQWSNLGIVTEEWLGQF